MKPVLIDTQALIWASERPHRLTPAAARVVDDRLTSRLASVASV